ncbi:hypothetical protein [Desulfopila inferna]|nr:hypothetical protein [Desulfopila inferna]
MKKSNPAGMIAGAEIIRGESVLSLSVRKTEKPPEAALEKIDER